MRYWLPALVLLFVVTAFITAPAPVPSKIGGVSLVAPVNKVDNGWVTPVKKINAGWVAMLPYAYSYVGKPKVIYDIPQQWWGERLEGLRSTVKHARQGGLKVMLKPMVWVPGSWPGDFDLPTEKLWLVWEREYSNYIMKLIRMAEEEGVSIFCIGTEYRTAVEKRPQFWRGLIKQVRKNFSGKVTYAANWDDYLKVPFWKDLDYIGIDAYFPLSDKATPPIGELKRKWQVPSTPLRVLSRHEGKQVLFTEFGYRSIDRGAWKQWELEGIGYSEKVNMQAQVNSYTAFFETFWEEDWFAGVFLWQWYDYYNKAGGPGNSDYTPQRKPAEKVISAWYAK